MGKVGLCYCRSFIVTTSSRCDLSSAFLYVRNTDWQPDDIFSYVGSSGSRRNYAKVYRYRLDLDIRWFRLPALFHFHPDANKPVPWQNTTFSYRNHSTVYRQLRSTPTSNYHTEPPHNDQLGRPSARDLAPHLRVCASSRAGVQLPKPHRELAIRL